MGLMDRHQECPLKLHPINSKSGPKVWVGVGCEVLVFGQGKVNILLLSQSISHTSGGSIGRGGAIVGKQAARNRQAGR